MYVKLGNKAENFSDPITGFTIVKGEVKELNAAEVNSLKIKRALTGGHLAHASKDDFKEFEKKMADSEKSIKKSAPGNSKELEEENKALRKQITVLEENIEELEDENKELKEELEGLKGGDQPSFEEMTKEQLVEYYKKTYEVSEEDLKVFSKKNKEGMIEELETLEEEA